MTLGSIVKSSSIVQNLGPSQFPQQYRETWRCKKKFQFVFVLIGIEEFGKPIDPHAAMSEMGWKPKRAKK